MTAELEHESDTRVEPLNRPRMLTHGTLECRSLKESRPFYEEFLGLECVHHAPRAMMLRKGGYWAIVCLEAGSRVRPLRVGNHWGIDMETRADVDRAHALALEHKSRYGIQKVTKIVDNHGTYGFYFMDRDGNWWEFQYAGEGQGTGNGRYDTHFARGDIKAGPRPRRADRSPAP
ncbi:MAG TPA: VOC family protein [Stellaceae bacterium]|nr:VOC family protein [Stellaceae bacterium]